MPIGSVLVFQNPGFPEKRYRVTASDAEIQVSFPLALKKGWKARFHMFRYIVISVVSAGRLDRSGAARNVPGGHRADIDPCAGTLLRSAIQGFRRPAVAGGCDASSAAGSREPDDRRQIAVGARLHRSESDCARRKSVFQEVCILDPEYALDSSQFAPKVLALFNDAKSGTKKDQV